MASVSTLVCLFVAIASFKGVAESKYESGSRMRKTLKSLLHQS
ncbi:hypothetical protein [aff. Roholtiella sp. LEGE 12411]|jgi:hypothetical protein|nr:hypothetical protein [aff. Roholtiella sp. LEGE 12411]